MEAAAAEMELSSSFDFHSVKTDFNSYFELLPYGNLLLGVNGKLNYKTVFQNLNIQLALPFCKKCKNKLPRCTLKKLIRK